MVYNSLQNDLADLAQFERYIVEFTESYTRETEEG